MPIFGYVIVEKNHKRSMRMNRSFTKNPVNYLDNLMSHRNYFISFTLTLEKVFVLRL